MARGTPPPAVLPSVPSAGTDAGCRSPSGMGPVGGVEPKLLLDLSCPCQAQDMLPFLAHAYIHNFTHSWLDPFTVLLLGATLRKRHLVQIQNLRGVDILVSLKAGSQKAIPRNVYFISF